jgi:hypothetical protein
MNMDNDRYTDPGPDVTEIPVDRPTRYYTEARQMNIPDARVEEVARTTYESLPPRSFALMFDLQRGGITQVILGIGPDPETDEMPDLEYAMFAAATAAKVIESDAVYVIGQSSITRITDDGVGHYDGLTIFRWGRTEPCRTTTAVFDEDGGLGEWSDWDEVEGSEHPGAMFDHTFGLDPPFTPREVLASLAAKGWVVMLPGGRRI